MAPCGVRLGMARTPDLTEDNCSHNMTKGVQSTVTDIQDAYLWHAGSLFSRTALSVGSNERLHGVSKAGCQPARCC